MLNLYLKNGRWYWHCVANGAYERHGPFLHRNEALYDMQHQAPVDGLIMGYWRSNRVSALA